jgi:predicted transposase/invertase (TIGR01784 family)
MPKFNKNIKELENNFEKWMYVIRNLNKLDRIPEELKDGIFLRLFEVAEIAKFTPAEVRNYEDSLKAYRDLKNSIDTAREEGEIKGKIEGKTEIAKNLKNKGFALTEIAEITGLAKEDIEGI